MLYEVITKMIINEHVRDYINSMEHDLPEELDSLERRLLVRKVPIIRKEAQALLRFMLQVQRPKRILVITSYSIHYTKLYEKLY